MASSNFVNGNDVATFVLETDAPYNILDFDQGLCTMTGYSPRELSKKICTLDNLLYVEDFTEVIASMNYQLSISNLISIQHRIVTKSGTVLTVLCNGQAFSLNDGRDVLQCVFTDITNLENAANETVRAKTDLEIFANTVPSGVSKHLLDNNLSLLWANNFFYDMCGYSEHDYKEKFGKSTLQLVLSEDLALVIDALADLTRNYRFVNRVTAFMMPAMMFLMNVMSLVIVWIGGHQIEQATMQVGDMMAFMQYAMQIIMAFLMICMTFILMPRAAVSVNRVNEVLATEPSVRDAEQPVSLGKNPRGEIEFRNVCFRYENADEDVISNISFTAKPGETTAFIGSTGSGKSTLINLIPRFYDVTQGEILFDGVDVRKIPQHELRAKIGYVPQKGVLFSGDIDSNLRYGAPDASEDDLALAAAIAQAQEFIQEKPEGMKTPIAQGGGNVSGGQKQRLSIARALAKKAPVYIFDDSFSALDFKTDAALRRALPEHTGDSTVLIVAQRVSTIMNAQQIIVLDEGRIAGKGTHRELLETCPTYREIAQSQLSKEELE